MKILAIAILLAQIVGTWHEDMTSIGAGMTQTQLTVRGGKLVISQTYGKALQDSDYTAALPIAQIACARAEKTSLYIYGATQTSGSEFITTTGKTKPTDYLFLSWDTAAQAHAMTASLESAVPRVKHVLNACKGPVDLYHLKFVAPVNTHEVATGVYGNGSFLHGTYTMTANSTRLYYEDRASSGGDSLFTQLKELPFAQISCVFRHKDGQGLTILSRIPDGVIGRDEKGRVFAGNEILVLTDNSGDTDDLLNSLEAANPVFKAKLGDC